MKPIHTICYISNAAPDLSDSDIEAIFNQASTQNNEYNVSGILLYNLEHFFQVLEGDEEYIIDLYENKIKKDTRHLDIYEVYNKTTEKPVFMGYDSKFNIIKTEEDLQKIRKYLSSVRTTTSDKLTRLLRPFVIFQKLDK
tara:strand:+ start:821 stop:1240 length:420 start_codon:yes stop_codon:yes gene_type:complete